MACRRVGRETGRWCQFRRKQLHQGLDCSDTRMHDRDKPLPAGEPRGAATHKTVLRRRKLPKTIRLRQPTLAYRVIRSSCGRHGFVFNDLFAGSERVACEDCRAAADHDCKLLLDETRDAIIGLFPVK